MDPHHLDLRAVAHALGGDVVGRNRLLCPGPGHRPHDRSLSIKLTASGGFVCHSFAGDPWRDCRDYVREKLGLPRWREDKLPYSPRPIPQPQPQIDSRQNLERARRIWDEGLDPRVAPVLDYFKTRALDLPDELCGSVLRFHASCPWRTDDRVDFVPCLIACFRSLATDEVTAITRIRLDQPERWPKVERKMIGDIRGSAIKLNPIAQQLCVAEGLESALAARQLRFGAVWALGSAEGSYRSTASTSWSFLANTTRRAAGLPMLVHNFGQSMERRFFWHCLAVAVISTII